MNFIQRAIKAAFSPPRLRRVTLFPTWAEETPRWLFNAQNFISEGFELNAIIYAAVMYKARAAQTVNAYAYTGSREEPEPLPPDHPLSVFCDRPNPFMSFQEMQAVNHVYYNIFGNCYVAIVKQPHAVTAYPLRPDWIAHVYDRKKQTLLGYTYAPDGVPENGMSILAQDMLHVRLPNPGDIYGGMGPGLSPLYPLSRSADVDNAATAFLKLFFEKGAMPPGIITTDQQIDDDTAGMLRERWIKTYGNYNNWTEPLVFGAGASYTRIGLTFDELDMAVLDARNESRMAMPFGVPLTLIESRPSIVQSTYSNKETDERMFWNNVMFPELRAFETEWEYYLRDDTGATIAFNYTEVPAFITKRVQRAQELGAALKDGAVTFNEYRAALGLEPWPPESGDVRMLPLMIQLVPLYGKPAPPTETGAASSEDEEAPQKQKALSQTTARPLTEAQKAAHYIAFDAKAVVFEPQAGNAAAAAFEDDRRAILAIVQGAQAKAYQAKATVAWQPTLLEAEDYVRTAGKAQWRKKFIPVFEALIVAQDEALFAEFGMAFDVRNLTGEAWFQNYVMKFADEIADTNAKDLHALFEKALAEGWSVGDMEKQVGIMFDTWIKGESAAMSEWALERLPVWRRELIARDQTLRASNAGAYHLYDEWGVQQKEWLATSDARTRPAHRAANGQVVAIGAPFEVGDSRLMYPGDPDGEPADVIQCRCTTIPVLSE